MVTNEAVTNQTLAMHLYEEIEGLIKKGKHALAESKLQGIAARDARWHFLYSLILLNKAWFDSAKQELQTATLLSPANNTYKEALIKLMGRHYNYSDDYYRRPHHHNRGCCCCCGDGCCEFSCCDLICLDSCCECMGGDLIDCI